MREPDIKALQACLVPLLDALGAGGGAEASLRGLEIDRVKSLPDMLNAMAALGFSHRSAKTSLRSLRDVNLPCLIAEGDGNFLVVLRRNDDSLFAFDGRSARYKRMKTGSRRVRAFRFQALEEGNERKPGADWFWSVAGRFRKYLIIGSVFSIALGVLSLLYPLLMTAMYGRLAATSEGRFVVSLAFGATLYLVADAGLRFLRGSLLDYSSARFGQTIGAEIFRRLLSFQTSFTESAPLDSQIRRVRDFETISDFIGGPAFAAIFDIPFLILNIFWLAGAGPRLLIAPLLALLFFALASALFYPIVKKAQANLAREDGERHDLFARIVAAKSQLSGAARGSWLERFSRASRTAALSSYELQRVNGMISSLSSLAVSLGGLATLYFGILDVFADRARPEALVAAMLLVWRVLEPARSAFVVITQLDGVSKSVDQIKRFLSLPLELPSLAPRPLGTKPGGDLGFHEVFFRYGSEGYPALQGIDFVARSGSILAIGGHAGSGKTTIAKLALGLYRPQSGRITLGGQNILQIDPALLRQSLAYAPTAAPLFPETVLGNIRLGAAEAQDMEITALAEELGLLALLATRGWDLMTSLSRKDIDTMSDDIGRLIALARAFSRKSSTLIIDGPELGIPPSSRKAVASIVTQRREDGDTIILMTNDGFFSVLADEGLRLDGGRATTVDRPIPEVEAKRRAS